MWQNAESLCLLISWSLFSHLLRSCANTRRVNVVRQLKSDVEAEGRSEGIGPGYRRWEPIQLVADWGNPSMLPRRMSPNVQTLVLPGACKSVLFGYGSFSSGSKVEIRLLRDQWDLRSLRGREQNRLCRSAKQRVMCRARSSTRRHHFQVPEMSIPR